MIKGAKKKNGKTTKPMPPAAKPDLAGPVEPEETVEPVEPVITEEGTEQALEENPFESPPPFEIPEPGEGP